MRAKRWRLLRRADAHPAFINLAHSKEAEAKLTNQLALALIQITRSDVRAEARIKFGSKACDVCKLRQTVAEQRSQRHSVNIACRCCLRCVHVSVRVKPD